MNIFKKLIKNFGRVNSVALLICIVLLIIEPCIFMALKHCDNPGYAKSIINLNTLVAFVLGLFILHNDFV